MQVETESFWEVHEVVKYFWTKCTWASPVLVQNWTKKRQSLCRSGGKEAQVLNFGLKWNPFSVENMMRTVILKTAHLSSETSITEIIIS